MTRVAILTWLQRTLTDNTRREIVNVLTKMGFEVEASHHEVAVGQHEIDFKYDEVLRACDKIQIFKLVVKTIARKHGLVCNLYGQTKIWNCWIRYAL